MSTSPAASKYVMRRRNGGMMSKQTTPPGPQGPTPGPPFEVIRSQAIDAGVPVVSNVLELDIAMDIPGCTEVTATNYDAMATSDDGSCTYCSGISADIKTSADVALYDGCTELYELYIDNTSGLFSVDLPQLELVTTYLSVNGNADLQFVNLPMLREVGDYAYIATNSALESVDLSGLEYSEGLYVNTNDVLQSIDLMSLTSILYYVNIISNPVLCLDAAIDWATISPGGYYVDSPGCAGLSCELTNAGFEDGVITPWVTSSASITTDSWEGTYAALIDGNNYIKQYFDVPVPVSELVSATFYTWHDTTDSPAMSTEWGYSDLSTGSGFYGSGELDGWQQHDMLADLDPSKELDYILIWGYSGGGALADITLVDAVSFCR